MSDDAFAALEALVGRAAESVVRLRRERDLLRREVKSLEQRVAELESRVAGGREHLDQMDRLSAERSVVRERLQGLLQRLEEAGHDRQS